MGLWRAGSAVATPCWNLLAECVNSTWNNAVLPASRATWTALRPCINVVHDVIMRVARAIQSCAHAAADGLGGIMRWLHDFVLAPTGRAIYDHVLVPVDGMLCSVGRGISSAVLQPLWNACEACCTAMGNQASNMANGVQDWWASDPMLRRALHYWLDAVSSMWSTWCWLWQPIMGFFDSFCRRISELFTKQ